MKTDTKWNMLITDLEKAQDRITELEALVREMRETLLSADAKLSLLFYRAGNSLPWVTLSYKLWNHIYAVLWEASNWTPNKRHFKKMVCLKARDLRPEIDDIHKKIIEKKT